MSNLFHFIDEEDLIYEDKKEEKKEESIDLLKPDNLDDYLLYSKEVEECKKWFNEYEVPNKNPKILMLLGKKGCGKSLLAQLLLKEFKYDKKEFTDEQLTKKQISELFKNSINYKNINEFKVNCTKYGFIFDNIETLLETGDNIIFNELMNIIKSSKKYEIKREKNIIKNEKKSKKEKSKNSKKNNELLENESNEISLKNSLFSSQKNDDYNINNITLYNPIICTCNYTNDKKMNELKKLCKIIDLQKPCDNDLNLIINKMCKLYNFEIKDLIRNEIYEYCEYDIRKIINTIKYIINFNNFSGTIGIKEFKTYVLIYGKVDLNCTLNEASFKVLNDKISVDEANILYSLDTLLIPLMIHHNLLNYIKNCTIKNCTIKDCTIKDCSSSSSNKNCKEEIFKVQFEAYEKSLENLCIYDEIQTAVYKLQERDLLPQFSSFFSLYAPNIYLNNLELLKNGAFKIEFTNILNKISQLEVNKKMILNAFFSTHRLILDENELMFIIEIFLNYLKISRDSSYDDNIFDDNDDEIEENKKEKKSRESKNSKNKNYDFDNCEYKELINIMNKYNIDTKSLENILKIEKLNLFENKNPKRLTLKIKEELDFYSTAQCMNVDDKEKDYENNSD
jgi:hypothetical protein